MNNKRKIEILELVKDDLESHTEREFICNSIKSVLGWNDEAYKMVKWFQSTKKSIPNEFKNKNWINENAWWHWHDKEIRIKYLEYLINQLENGDY